MWKLYIKRKEDDRLAVEMVATEHAAEVELLDTFVQWVDPQDAPQIVRMPECEVIRLVELQKEFWRQSVN